MWPFGRRSRQTSALAPAAANNTTSGGSESPPQRRRWSLTALLAVSIGFTACIGLVAPLWDAYAQLIARADGFGIAAICGGAILAALFVVLILRELLSFMRLRRLEGLRRTAQALRREDARLDDGARRKAARRVLRGVIGLYRGRPPGTVNLAPLAELRRAKDASADMILGSIEANALAPLDREALRIVRRSSLRVGTFTAVSPWGVVDMLIVAYMNLAMIRAVAQHYNARPGLLSTLKLALGYAAGIGASGAMGTAASSILERIGGRIAGYLIGALAKGSVNATSTALLGLFAVAAVRPIPFDDKQKPGLLDLVFPPDGAVAKAIEKVVEVRDNTIVAVQGLVGRGGPAPPASRQQG